MDSERRYASLLQPIRDLTENWDIDIAHLLEDYLDDLDHIRLTIHGQENLNFAEAALVIQGSTSIYSKKVEYLYNLVIQALDLITTSKEKKDKNNKEASNSQTGKSGNAGAEDDDVYLWNDDITYLLLDDVIKQGTNIDMIDKTQDHSLRKSNGRLSNASDCSRASRSSAILMNSILHDSQSLSFDGDSRNHAAALKISSSLINDDGAVMFSSFGQFKNANKVVAPISHEDAPRAGDDGGYDFGDNNWDDGDDGADDYGPADYGNLSMGEPSQTPIKQVPSNLINSKPSVQPASWGSLPNFPTLMTAKLDTAAPPAHNPLALYDPHDPTEANHSKPVKKDKRTYRIPTTKQNQLKVNTGTSGLTRRQVMLKSLQSGNTTNIKSPSQLMSSADLISMITRCSISSSSQSNKHLSLTGNTAPVSRSLAQLSQKKKVSGCSNPLLKLDAVTESSQPLASTNFEQFNKQENQNDDDLDVADGGFYGGDDDHDDDDYGPAGYDNPSQAEPQFEGEMNDALYHLQEEKLLAQRVENALNDAGLNTSIGNFSVISAADSRHSIDSLVSNKDTFEILCKKYIQNFIIGTEKYNRETNLVKRVTEWTNKIEPLLKEQEERVVFDIHNYSDTTLHTIHSLQKDKKTSPSSSSTSLVHFSDIVHGKPSYEVSRVFLACLQLANLGNVDFQQTDKTNFDDFDVNLLNEKSQRLNIEMYRAPSVEDYE